MNKSKDVTTYKNHVESVLAEITDFDAAGNSLSKKFESSVLIKNLRESAAADIGKIHSKQKKELENDLDNIFKIDYYIKSYLLLAAFCLILLLLYGAYEIGSNIASRVEVPRTMASSNEIKQTAEKYGYSYDSYPNKLFTYREVFQKTSNDLTITVFRDSAYDKDSCSAVFSGSEASDAEKDVMIADAQTNICGHTPLIVK